MGCAEEPYSCHQSNSLFTDKNFIHIQTRGMSAQLFKEKKIQKKNIVNNIIIRIFRLFVEGGIGYLVTFLVGHISVASPSY